MAKLTSNGGFIRASANIAHAFLRDQVLIMLSPVYLFPRRRAIVHSVGEIADLRTCGPNRAIDPHPTGTSRS